MSDMKKKEAEELLAILERLTKVQTVEDLLACVRDGAAIASREIKKELSQEPHG